MQTGKQTDREDAGKEKRRGEGERERGEGRESPERRGKTERMRERQGGWREGESKRELGSLLQVVSYVEMLFQELGRPDAAQSSRAQHYRPV